MKRSGIVNRQNSTHYPEPNTGRKEEMSKEGYRQGDMTPRVTDFQKPDRDFSQTGFSKTDEYIERQDRFQAREADEIKKQGYIGRYS